MKKGFLLAAFVLALSSFGLAQAQAKDAPKEAPKDTPKTVTSILENGVKGIEAEFVPAAEAMPEDKYNFVPATGEFKGVRTFAQQIKHVAAVNYMLGAAILGEKPPIELGGENGPDSVKSKADVMKFIKDSYAYSHKAVATVNAENAAASIKSPFGNGTTSRMGLAIVITAHGFDHYGQMVEYLRLNGIVPPASR